MLDYLYISISQPLRGQWQTSSQTGAIPNDKPRLKGMVNGIGFTTFTGNYERKFQFFLWCVIVDYPMIDDYGISVHLLWFTLEVYDATLIGLW